MKISILGAGRMGGNLAKAWFRSGHQIYLGVRNLDSSRVVSLQRDLPPAVRFGSLAEAVNTGEVIVVALPFQAVNALLTELPDPGRKIIIDCTNPVVWQGGPVVAPGINVAARLQQQWLDALVVKAFNTIGAAHILSPIVAGEPADMYYCSDDAEAGETVSRLARDVGLNPVDAGALNNAPLIENVSLLLMTLSATRLTGHSLTMKLRYD
ncbi:MAG: NADPH-dependent F420 reductase [Fidelibacterota bacterium]